MEPKDIRELIELIGKSNFATFEMEREGFRLRLVKEPPVAAVPQMPAPAPAPAAAVEAAPEPQAAPADNGLVNMTSPIVGTFYNAASPDADPFVDVGSRVKPGQVMCIVEAMKVMNEIEAEIAAEVVEVVVKNEQPVEYGEVLFRLRPL